MNDTMIEDKMHGDMHQGYQNYTDTIEKEMAVREWKQVLVNIPVVTVFMKTVVPQIY